MTFRLLAGAAGLALGLGIATSASAMNLQPGMLTMMQQGGNEHGVQVGCTLPGYDPRDTCAYSRQGWRDEGYGHRRPPAPFRRLRYGVR